MLIFITHIQSIIFYTLIRVKYEQRKESVAIVALLRNAAGMWPQLVSTWIHVSSPELTSLNSISWDNAFAIPVLREWRQVDLQGLLPCWPSIPGESWTGVRSSLKRCWRVPKGQCPTLSSGLRMHVHRRAPVHLSTSAQVYTKRNTTERVCI